MKVVKISLILILNFGLVLSVSAQKEEGNPSIIAGKSNVILIPVQFVSAIKGETVEELFVSYNGLVGDRVYAIHSNARATRFPWFTGRQYPDLIRHTARYREREATLHPTNPEADHPDLPGDSVQLVLKRDHFALIAMGISVR